jgi:hypothetical protein
MWRVHRAATHQDTQVSPVHEGWCSKALHESHTPRVTHASCCLLLLLGHEDLFAAACSRIGCACYAVAAVATATSKSIK